ncbi:MAG: methylenetetrahydrofolate dehydrogenase, partial [Methylocystis sp.]|nr:methylenetetrahydrofolate dehydrogenase [Methylocystis sp.]
AAALLAREGAEVAITSRVRQRAEAATKAVKDRFGVNPKPIEAFDYEARAAAIKGAHIVFAAGAIGVQLLEPKHWQDNSNIELIADCNAQPPLGVGGVEATDKAKERHGKIVIGALGAGGLKLKLHRACIGQLFERADRVLDAEEIYAQAKAMA